jgi:geranylgeranyl pyrophosphate synthase
MSANTTIESVRKIFKIRGGSALRNVRKTLLQKYTDDSYSSQALRYLSKVTLHNALPVFPALLSMANEAVGGDSETAIPFGEGILLISFAADLHDDVIDQSFTKGSKQTVLGKFNAPTAILAGDIILVEGLRQLTQAAESLPKEKSKEIIKWVSESVFEICTAEALQFRLKDKTDLTPEEYYKVISLKAGVPELCMKIGAFLGTSNIKDVECLGRFGRVFGINSVIVEEFADLLNLEEFKNRLKHEIAPLPMLYANQNAVIRTNITNLLYSEIDKVVHEKIIDTVLDSIEVNELAKTMISNAEMGKNFLPMGIERKIREELENLLFVPLKIFQA